VGLSVGLTVLAFPPVGWWPLAFAMHAPLAAALEGRRPLAAFAIAWTYLIAIGLVIARWMIHALAVEYAVPEIAAWLFTAVVIGVVALPGTLALGGYAALRPRVAPLAAPLLFAAAFTLGEWVRAEWMACPWVLPGHAVAFVPLLIQVADIGGVSLVGFWLCAVGAGIGLALQSRSALPVVFPGAIAALVLGYGAWRLDEPSDPVPALDVAVVQAAVPQSERFQPGSAQRNTLRHAELTRQVVRSNPPDLVVWSETAVDANIDLRPELGATLAALVDEIRLPLVTGAPRMREGQPINAVVVYAPGRGLVETYAKQRLVPFAESDPPWGGPLAPLVSQLTAGIPYLAGTEATVFRVGPMAFSTPVCFEITYPDLVRRFRQQGATLLVNVSNDAWFGRTGYADIHFLQAIFRAVEFRSWVVRGANTGISGFLDPWGRVVAILPVFQEGVLRGQVGPAVRASLYQRAGEAPLLVGLAAVVLLSVTVGRQRG
jgi:apolipoprotein N-acyltransferase